MVDKRNYNSSVTNNRIEKSDSLDDFPTPVWAVNAFIEHILKKDNINGMTALEPACGRGYMAYALRDYFRSVTASDIANYGTNDVKDFLTDPYMENSFDWMITNPPFKLAEEFINKGLKVAKTGVAVLVRTNYIEGIGRFNRLFSVNPPSLMAQYAERVPIVKGRMDKSATTATAYCWLVWNADNNDHTKVVWIPPCRKLFEKSWHYDSNIISAKFCKKISEG